MGLQLGKTQLCWAAEGPGDTSKKNIHFGGGTSARKAIINEYFILTYGELFCSAKMVRGFLPSSFFSPFSYRCLYE